MVKLKLLSPCSLLLFCCFCPVYPFSQPTPTSFNKGICESLTPNHGVTPQTKPPPFKLTFDPMTYTAGVTTQVKVTLSSCTTTPFKGFLVQARGVKTTDKIALGKFTKTTDVQMGCEGTSASHINNQPKTKLELQYVPPTTGGHIMFRATFVQARTTYWVNVISAKLTDTKAAAASPEATPTVLEAKCSGDNNVPPPPPPPQAPTGNNDANNAPSEKEDETDESKGQMTNAPTMHGIVVCLIIVCFVNFI